MTAEKTKAIYEVLGPWAEADPIPQRGLIVERLEDLAGKKIGLFHMWKRASKPTLGVLERKIKEKYPAAEFSWYEESQLNTPEIESENKAHYEDWLKELDTVIFTYGD
jgi:hypothetical protein